MWMVWILRENSLESDIPYSFLKKIEKETYDVEELQVPIYSDGKLVYDLPDIETIRVHSIEAQAKMWVEIYRLEYPHLYYVDLTEKLLNTKMTLLKKNRQ